MDHLPIFLDIRGRKVVIDGGGTTAARRVERALDAGAQVHVFDPAPEGEVLDLLNRRGVTHYARLPVESDFAGCVIAYGASDVPERDEFLHAAAKAEGALVNVADVKPLCDFITPSIVDRSPVTIAISTGGAAPVIARILRARIESLLPSGYGRLASFLSSFRGVIETHITGGRARRRFWEQMIEGPIGDAFLAGDETRAEDLIDQSLAGSGPDQTGGVWLVGIGSGAQDLLTFRALSVMQRADVILHDPQLSKDILALTRRDATRMIAEEAEIDSYAKLANSGRRVVWLVSGDPAQRADAKSWSVRLTGQGTEVQVVPGVSNSGYSTHSEGNVISLSQTSDQNPHAMSLSPRASL
ncbi:NAD(P)-dependent oxidoreductase [Aliiroseovarius sp. F20344]|uniref:NAD(P)-dependent oxidoreductase n=1 Tax=Aliiroseovarius sp. F20344 TaxID=2926414 RepID=UPI001FF4874B|nr:NAD(P)-dependent oxidoreductase [Aliiroseovarius sp. F20344]MCK0141299.1 siroheme synthase [Aliiroseovarius sp. F20344]